MNTKRIFFFCFFAGVALSNAFSFFGPRTGIVQKTRERNPTAFDHKRNLDKVDGTLIKASKSDGEDLYMKEKVLMRIQKFGDFSNKNFFLVGMFVAVSFARLFPKLGNNGGILRPELFIGKYGVTFIFLLSGLSLELSQLSAAAANFKMNSLVQLSTFAAWPYLIGLPLKYILSKPLFLDFFPEALIDGLLILTCLPTTVNMCVILTTAAGGNTASALCNAIISNLAGIFLTPALLFRFFGATIELPFLAMFLKLCGKVLLPVAVGQALRATPVKHFYDKHSKKFKRLSEVILLSILWNAFCTAICNSLDISLKQGIGLMLLLPFLHLLSFAALQKIFSLPALRFSKGDVVAGAFCGSQKTLAFGLPLINTIFEGNPNVALYCAPLMLVHPLQLTIGSTLVPRLRRFINSEAEAT